MNSDIVPSVSTIHGEFGSNEELQMASTWDMSMQLQMYTDGNLLGDEECNSMDNNMLLNQGGGAIGFGPPLQPHTPDYEMGSSSLDEILRDSPLFESEFGHTKRNGHPHKRKSNNALILRRNNGVRKRKTDMCSSFFSTQLFHSEVPSKKKNNKFSENITILQKLVSPYGKADMASVLEEASLYIKLLQQQIQDLFHIFVRSYDVARAVTSSQRTEEERQSLRSKGLCLVPSSFSRNLPKQQ